MPIPNAPLHIHLHGVIEQHDSPSVTLGAGMRMVLDKSTSLANVAKSGDAHATVLGKERWIRLQSRAITGGARLLRETEGRIVPAGGMEHPLSCRDKRGKCLTGCSG